MNTHEKPDMKQIKALLEAFYEGETTVEQEKILLHYFQSTRVEEDLADEKFLFLQMYQPEPTEMPAGLGTRLESMIDQLAQKKTNRQTILSGTTKKLFRSWIGIAASIALLAGSGFYLYYINDTGSATTPTGKDTYTDPRMAQAEAEKALFLLSSKFNEGIDKLESASANIEKTNAILNKSLKSVKL